MTTKLSKQAYSPTALQKAAYELAADLDISISEDASNYVVAAKSINPDKPNDDLAIFVRLANDYSLREQLALQTEPLRNLILAHAYSKTAFIQK